MDANAIKHEIEMMLDDYRCYDPNYITALHRMRAKVADKIYSLIPVGAKNTEQQLQPDNSPKMCEECGEYPADLPSNLCCGCDAYKEHLS